ncbi:MAG: site-2 protease family protein [Defluviitaleaceae bacterium]|nr:site-2 protease family protein [Defluviitaleaceae bacterium]MCL2240521.1 site-2 protease family protein [Defluviitaleaceae bacterium]
MDLIYLLPGAFFAPVIHEWVKAMASTLQGDPTPRSQGFLSGNLFKYFEPIGFLMMLFFGGFGWGQPVPTAALHYKNRRKGTLITYIAPSLANLLLGIVSIAAVSLLAGEPLHAFLLVRITHVHVWTADAHWIIMMVLFAFAQCNILLALFNLIPVHPLDASKILQLFARPDTLVKLNHFEKPMQIALMLALVFGLVSFVFSPVWNAILRMVWLA